MVVGRRRPDTAATLVPVPKVAPDDMELVAARTDGHDYLADVNVLPARPEAMDGSTAGATLGGGRSDDSPGVAARDPHGSHTTRRVSP
jgi:hypothetical protein